MLYARQTDLSCHITAKPMTCFLALPCTNTSGTCGVNGTGFVEEVDDHLMPRSTVVDKNLGGIAAAVEGRCVTCLGPQRAVWWVARIVTAEQAVTRRVRVSGPGAPWWSPVATPGHLLHPPLATWSPAKASRDNPLVGWKLRPAGLLLEGRWATPASGGQDLRLGGSLDNDQV